MTTPTKDTSNAEAQADKEALVAAANTKFINEATTVMAEAVSMGKFSVTLNTFEYVSLSDITTYFQNLGYGVDILRFRSLYEQPVELFGYWWDDYWAHRLICRGPFPHRVEISWYS